ESGEEGDGNLGLTKSHYCQAANSNPERNERGEFDTSSRCHASSAVSFVPAFWVSSLSPIEHLRFPSVSIYPYV
ncbi:12405_t:CDS:1, partial [Acaulospora colombiana]